MSWFRNHISFGSIDVVAVPSLPHRPPCKLTAPLSDLLTRGNNLADDLLRIYAQNTQIFCTTKALLLTSEGQSTTILNMNESQLSSQSFESLKTTLASPENVIQAGNTKLAAEISTCYFDRGVQNGALWSAVLDAAIRIKSDHPAQTSLANAVRELYNSKKTSKTRGWD